MAFMSVEKTKEIREELKKTFPEFKFSVRNDNYTAIRVTLVSGPVRFVESNYEQLNHYYPENYAHSDILKKMIEIINRTNYDRSEIQFDHHDVGFYVTISQGQWDRPYVVKGA